MTELYDMTLQQAYDARAATVQATPTIDTYSPQSGALFFNIPLEIRDQIYNEVFGDQARDLTYEDLTIRVYREVPQIINVSSTSAIRGLPRWVLSCKQICTEALAELSRTHIFEATRRRIKLDYQSCRRGLPSTMPAPSMHNPLVFREGSFWHVVLRIGALAAPRRDYICSFGFGLEPAEYADGDPILGWLALVKICRGYGLRLSVVWERYDYNDINYLSREGKAFGFLDGAWIGVFRNINVIATYKAKGDIGGLEGMMEFAEAWIRQLLGLKEDEGSLVWEDTVNMGEDRGRATWQRRLAAGSKL